MELRLPTEVTKGNILFCRRHKSGNSSFGVNTHEEWEGSFEIADITHIPHSHTACDC
jgi:hypothetical protein